MKLMRPSSGSQRPSQLARRSSYPLLLHAIAHHRGREVQEDATRHPEIQERRDGDKTIAATALQSISDVVPQETGPHQGGLRLCLLLVGTTAT